MKSKTTRIDHKHYFHVNGDIGNELVQQLLRVCILAIPSVYTYVYAQSMDLCNLWVVLCKVAINTLQNNPSICCPLPNYNPWIVQSVYATLQKVWIKQMRFCFVLRSCKLSYLAIYSYVSNISYF